MKFYFLTIHFFRWTNGTNPAKKGSFFDFFGGSLGNFHGTPKFGKKSALPTAKNDPKIKISKILVSTES
jgi:hypothetical protein